MKIAKFLIIIVLIVLGIYFFKGKVVSIFESHPKIRLNEVKFSMDLPDGWQVAEQSTANSTAYFLEGKGQGRAFTWPSGGRNLETIVDQEIASEQGLAENTQQMSQLMNQVAGKTVLGEKMGNMTSQAAELQQFQIASRENLMLDDHNAIEIIIDMKEVKRLETYIEAEDKFVVVTFVIIPEEFDSNLELIRSVYETVRLK